MTDVNRRQTLGLFGAGMALLAGCSETSDDGDGSSGNGTDSPADDDGEVPTYASFLPETDRSTYSYGAIDAATLQSLVDAEDAAAGDDLIDPLLGNPVVMAVLFGRIGATKTFGIYQEIDETPADAGEIVDANGVYALVGSYDRDAIGTALEDAGYARERDDTSYAVYTDADSGEVVGITDDVFAFTVPNQADPEFDPIDAVERTVETATGQRPPKHETDDEFARLLRAGETGGISLGRYTEADAFDVDTLGDQQLTGTLEFAFGGVEGATGVHQQLLITDDGATATAAVRYGDDDRVDLERLEVFGTQADAREVDHDGASVRIEAEYAGGLVDDS
ncbi:hypothetical protein [Natronorubrum thiooxidans]|uniref:Uncharacterized protein n=1 Tax=Natronorubrum thiooxidans TaxID=308853 RepID=A0A1N7E8D7_9EURY|nr:hypothetical protein [Natronorubrum thiooxidans]SIR84341.1 hypothetical protein SAMN05421752_103296 [Natronorubrum thiooxidans]